MAPTRASATASGAWGYGFAQLHSHDEDLTVRAYRSLVRRFVGA
ncbi:hypothetical protein [Corynebacterium halotolerans]